MNDGTFLVRQVSPSFVQLGRVTSQAFRPTPKDEGKLSAYDGDKITPEKSWVHYTTQLKHKSVGTLAVTVLECKQEALTASPDPDEFPEHVVIDFSAVTASQAEKKSKKLRAVADARGWQYQAATDK